MTLIALPLISSRPIHAHELIDALAAFCTCEFDDHDVRTSQCAGHSSLISDPLWILRLEFGRWLQARLIAEEFLVTA